MANVDADESELWMNRQRKAEVVADGDFGSADITVDDLISVASKAIALRERLGLDYDKLMIIAVIAARHSTLSHRPEERPFGPCAGESVLHAWNGTTMSLARRIGIPRESVRRKLEELRATGWLVPNGRNGRYRPSRRLLRTLAELMPSTRTETR